MLMAMTRRPLSASISKTVKTVSYRIELPTFLDESVLVATYSTRSASLRISSPKESYLSKDVIHGVTGRRVVLAENSKEFQDLDLEERIGDASNIMFRGVSSRDKRF